MFNTGDKVRIKDTATMASRYKVGDIATIIENVLWLSDEGGQTVRIEMEDGNTQLVRVSQLEAVDSTNYKAKAGDKIRITHPFMASGYQEGDCFTVERADANGVWVDGNHGFIANFEFEVLPESAAKPSTGIKVGDKVKVTQVVARLSGSYKVGDVLTVKETYANHPGYVKTDNGLLSPNEYTVITDETVDNLELEVIDEEIKIGDKVRLIDKFYEHPLWKSLPREYREDYAKRKGNVGTVSEIREGSGPIDKLMCVVEQEAFTEHPEYRKIIPVDLLEKVQPESKTLTDGPHPEFKAGDKFVVVNPPENCGLKVGDVITLDENDNTRDPWFMMNGHRYCENWENLAPVEAEPTQASPLYRQPYPHFVEGTSFRVVRVDPGDVCKVGDIVVLHENDNTHDPWFKMPSGDISCLFWDQVAPIETKEEPKRVPMTNVPHPEIKEGAKFVVLEAGCGFNVGDIVTLHHNDQTVNPHFKRDTDAHMAYAHWGYLAPIDTEHRYTEKQKQEARDIVYRLMTRRDPLIAVQTCTFPGGYLDLKDSGNKDRPHTVAILIERMYESSPRYWREAGRAVAYCSPGDEWSDDIGRMVALCKLLDKPLPGWIHG